MSTPSKTERGSANLKFVLFMAFLVACGFTGYKIIPVVYQASLFKDLMQHDVDVAASAGYQPTWIHDQLVKSFPEYGVPNDAVITPAQRDSRMEVRVQYSVPIEFPGYTYDYEFDHTARSTAFLTFK
jgi:hypothetical protein